MVVSESTKGAAKDVTAKFWINEMSIPVLSVCNHEYVNSSPSMS